MERRALKDRFLSDEDAQALYDSNPGLLGDPDLYCPTCNKTGSYLWPNKDTKVTCDCFEQLQLHKHYLDAGIGALFQRLSWNDYNGDEDVMTLADTYLDKSDQMVSSGIGVILWGDLGVGKTLGLTLLLKDLLHQGHKVFSTTFAGMVEMFTAGWYDVEEKTRFKEKIRNTKILLLDDLGREYKTKTALAETTFDDVLRSRVQSGRPTFITTNMSLEELGEGYGSGALSLLKETSFELEVRGHDYRQTAGKRKIEEIMAGLTRPIV